MFLRLASVFAISLLDVNAALAQAAPAAAPTTADGFMSLAPLFLIVFVFYFLVIRPQSKKMKQHQQMLESLRRGDKVTTAGGIIGTVVRVHDDNQTVELEIAENVKVKVVKATISDIYNRNVVAVDGNAEKKAADDNQDKKNTKKVA
jgi:preprotein translocase subunit YajC